jgi:hypothetical protein
MAAIAAVGVVVIVIVIVVVITEGAAAIYRIINNMQWNIMVV